MYEFQHGNEEMEKPIEKETVELTGEPLSCHFPVQNIGLAIQRGNASSQLVICLVFFFKVFYKYALNI